MIVSPCLSFQLCHPSSNDLASCLHTLSFLLRFLINLRDLAWPKRADCAKQTEQEIPSQVWQLGNPPSHAFLLEDIEAGMQDPSIYIHLPQWGGCSRMLVQVYRGIDIRTAGTRIVDLFGKAGDNLIFKLLHIVLLCQTIQLHGVQFQVNVVRLWLEQKLQSPL